MASSRIVPEHDEIEADAGSVNLEHRHSRTLLPPELLILCTVSDRRSLPEIHSDWRFIKMKRRTRKTAEIKIDPESIQQSRELIEKVWGIRLDHLPVFGRNVKPRTRLSRKVTKNQYQLKVTLKEVRPLVWRRLLVPGYVTLATLHNILQVCMGWDDGHLHEFICKGIHYLTRFQDDSEMGLEYGEEAENLWRLNELIGTEKGHLDYIYDFGDGWEHRIVVEKIKNLEPDSPLHPVCLAGKGNCPPEDCGGSGGYAHLLKVLANPRHKEHKELKEWAGDFDTEAFDLEWVNSQLRRIKV
jgi:hypothetical protein